MHYYFGPPMHLLSGVDRGIERQLAKKTGSPRIGRGNLLQLIEIA